MEMPQGDKSLMAELLERQIPVASSCGGEGVCAKCQIKVLKGLENLTPPTDIEELAKDRFKWKPNQRLSCQCRVLGDCTITTPYW